MTVEELIKKGKDILADSEDGVKRDYIIKNITYLEDNPSIKSYKRTHRRDIAIKNLKNLI